jgi:hypothetical protein
MSAAHDDDHHPSLSSDLLGDGCYLTYDPSSIGSLFLNWKHTPVEHALAFFRPKKPVPKFKYTTHGGREELIRDCAQAHIQRYYIGITQYVKICKDFHADLVVFTENVKFYLCEDDSGNVIRCKPNVAYSLEKIVAVACFDKEKTDLNVHVMEKFQFLEHGRSLGAALEL